VLSAKIFHYGQDGFGFCRITFKTMQIGDDSQETFILCRSASRAQKETAMHDRFERRIEDGLAKLVQSRDSRKQQ
jgi:hypothetical protein